MDFASNKWIDPQSLRVYIQSHENDLFGNLQPDILVYADMVCILCFRFCVSKQNPSQKKTKKKGANSNKLSVYNSFKF